MRGVGSQDVTNSALTDISQAHWLWKVQSMCKGLLLVLQHLVASPGKAELHKVLLK